MFTWILLLIKGGSTFEIWGIVATVDFLVDTFSFGFKTENIKAQILHYRRRSIKNGLFKLISVHREISTSETLNIIYNILNKYQQYENNLNFPNQYLIEFVYSPWSNQNSVLWSVRSIDLTDEYSLTNTKFFLVLMLTA